MDAQLRARGCLHACMPARQHAWSIEIALSLQRSLACVVVAAVRARRAGEEGGRGGRGGGATNNSGVALLCRPGPSGRRCMP
eukprot:251152-Chlamydomonas_euryale.AAC.3